MRARTTRAPRMKRLFEAFAPLLLIGAMVALAGCDKGQPNAGNVQAAESDFATGAFPPILTDTDYHTKPWTRDDCLKCHEEGVDDAPKVRHVSLPALAKDAKCRTCHVLIVGQKPPE